MTDTTVASADAQSVNLDEAVKEVSSDEWINAAPEETIFINLFKNVYEKDWKNFISYKAWYVKKDGSGVGTFPVGFGRFDAVHEKTTAGKEYVRNDYDKKFWLSVSVNDKTPEKGELIVTINEVDTKEYTSFFLRKKLTQTGKVGYSIEKPIEIAGTKYRANLSQNTSKERPHLFNLIFKDAGAGTGAGGSEAEIDFGGDADF